MLEVFKTALIEISEDTFNFSYFTSDERESAPFYYSRYYRLKGISYFILSNTSYLFAFILLYLYFIVITFISISHIIYKKDMEGI